VFLIYIPFLTIFVTAIITGPIFTKFAGLGGCG